MFRTLQRYSNPCWIFLLHFWDSQKALKLVKNANKSFWTLCPSPSIHLPGAELRKIWRRSKIKYVFIMNSHSTSLRQHVYQIKSFFYHINFSEYERDKAPRPLLNFKNTFKFCLLFFICYYCTTTSFFIANFHFYYFPHLQVLKNISQLQHCQKY